MKTHIVFALIFLICLSAPASAQLAVPPEGLKAEMAGQWEKAVRVYKDVLKHEPERVDLLLRISDIEARLGNPEKAAAALAEAARLAPDDAEIHIRLSHAYAVNDRPELALAAVERALEIEPDNLEYLRTRARLANWTGDSETAAESYNRILVLSPGDDSTLLDYARSSAWSGHTDDAASAYREYLDGNPEREDVYIEYAKVEAWRGNYVGSLSVLGHYQEEFGESIDYRREKARVLAWARRPTEAMELISPLLEMDPDDYEVNYSHTIALYHANRPSEAVESLEILSRLRPDSEETEDIHRFVLTPLRTQITVAGSFYTDSDDLDRYHGSVIAETSPRPEVRLAAGIEIDHLEADKGSGFDRISGGETAQHKSIWVGITNVASTDVTLDGHVGVADAESDEKFIFGAGLDYHPVDNVNLRLETDYGFYVISPRTLDLGIRRSHNRAQLDWEPDLEHTVILALGYSHFSDDNDSWEVIAAPRRAVLRREKINLDIGVRGTWYGFEEQLDNGYYDPDLYQSYMLTNLAYWKISDDDGVSVALDMGFVKDDEMDDFRFGWGLSVEGIFGLYRDVMLRVGASLFNNQRTAGGAFEAYEVHAALTCRF